MICHFSIIKKSQQVTQIDAKRGMIYSEMPLIENLFSRKAWIQVVTLKQFLSRSAPLPYKLDVRSIQILNNQVRITIPL